MLRSRVSILMLGALAGAAVSSSHPKAAHAEIVDRIVAVIQDEAIFLSDLERRIRPFQRELDAEPSAEARARRRETLYRQQLELMIDDKLLRRAARTAHVTVTDADVDRMIDGMAQQRHVSVSDIYQAIESEGLTRVEYRQFMESEVLRLRVMNVRVRGRVNITDADVNEEYRRRMRDLADHAPFHAAHIFFSFPEHPTAQQIADTQQRAQHVLDQLHAGGDFVELAHEDSDDASTKESGGDLGMIDPDDEQSAPPEWLVGALRDLQPGQVSPAVRGENGYHIFRLIERQPVNIPPLASVRTDLYNDLLQHEMERQQRIYLRELRRLTSVEVRL